MTVSLAPLLKQLRRIAEPAANEAASDVDLLVQFARSRNEAAFAALVQRHGPMVRSVCRRVLGHSDTADDAFQATFLILARKANSLTRPAALAGWLHGVAFRTARKARALQSRRRMGPLPADVAQPGPCADPLAEITARELLTIVDEEIAGLPERLRLPIILCCLEGQTQDEAAQRLGWSPGSVKGRLERGRVRLHARLARRGLTLPAALAALEVSSGPASALPATLASATVHAACQFLAGPMSSIGASQAAVALAQQTLRGSALKPLCVLLAGAVCASASAAVLSWCLGAPPTPREAAPAKDLLSRQPAAVWSRTGEGEPPAQRITLTGRVFDVAGKPVAEATVFLREQPRGWASSTWQPTESRNIAATKTDAQGGFAFRDTELPPPPSWRRQETIALDVVVQAPGHALGWRHVDSITLKRPLHIVLAPETQVQGQLVDRDGKPATRVAVRVSEIAALNHEKMAPLHSPEFVDLRWSSASLTTQTDDDGRIVLRGLPRSMRVTLTVIDPRFRRQEIPLATTNAPQPPLKYRFESALPEKTAPVLHGDFQASVELAHRLNVEVVFDDTGKRAVGARWAEPPIWSPPNREADKAGRFALDQLPPGALRLPIHPPDGSEYLCLEVLFDMKGEPRVIDHTVRLPRGVLVTGRVIEEGTGKGIAGAELEYFSTATNRELPRPFAYRTRTDADGHLRVPVPPGEGNLVLLTVPPGYLGHGLELGKSLRDAPPTHLRSFDVSVQKKPSPLEFVMSRGIEVVGQVIGPDGTAVQVTQIEELDCNPDRQVAWTAAQTGEIRLRGLSPATRYQFALIAQKLGLGAVVELTTPQTGDATPALRVKLEPLASMSGQVIDEDGKPIADAVVRLYRQTRNRLQGGNVGSVIREPIATTADGTFLWKDLVPGVEYSVHASANGYKSSHSDLWKAPGPQNLRIVLKAE